jgi:hypothetical protein
MRPDTFLATELAAIRVRDGLRAAERYRLLAAADEGRPASRAPIRRPSIRRPVAVLLAGVSRRSAALVRLLDDCVFEDLGRSLSPND